MSELKIESQCLELALWAEMTERMTPREIGGFELNANALRNELAFVIHCVALRAKNMTPGEMEVVECLIAGLKDQTDDWHVALVRPRSGRYPSPVADHKSFERDREIVAELESLTEKGIKLEAAVEAQRTQFGISRSTVFNAWRRREHLRPYHQRADVIESVYDQDEVPQARFGSGLFGRLLNYLSPVFPPIDE